MYIGTGKIVIKFPDIPHSHKEMPTPLWPEMWWVEREVEYIFRIGNIVHMEVETLGSQIDVEMGVDVTNLDVRQGKGTVQKVCEILKSDKLCEHVNLYKDSPSPGKCMLDIGMAYPRVPTETPLDPEDSKVDKPTPKVVT